MKHTFPILRLTVEIDNGFNKRTRTFSGDEVTEYKFEQDFKKKKWVLTAKGNIQ